MQTRTTLITMPTQSMSQSLYLGVSDCCNMCMLQLHVCIMLHDECCKWTRIIIILFILYQPYNVQSTWSCFPVYLAALLPLPPYIWDTLVLGTSIGLLANSTWFHRVLLSETVAMFKIVQLTSLGTVYNVDKYIQG